MPSERVSLKERGRQILGLHRRGNGGRALLKPSAGTSGPLGSNQGAAAGDVLATTPCRTIPGLHLRDAEPDAVGRIEALLDAEAAAATGEDDLASEGSSPSDVETTGPLPAVEWISPVSPHQAPAPPVRSVSGAARTGNRNRGQSAHPARPAPRDARAEAGRAPVDRAKRTQNDGASRRMHVEPTTTTMARSVSLSPQEEAALLARPDVQQHLLDLDHAIRSQYDRILTEPVSGHKEITDWCQSLLAEARTTVMYRRLGELARAEWDLGQVRARLDRAEASAKETLWPVFVLLWAAAWFAGYVVLVLRPAVVLPQLGSASSGNPPVLSWMMLQALAFGGIGSVAGVFGSLAGQIRDMSFDRRSVPFFLVKPFVGMALGCGVYLVFVVVAAVVGAVASVEVLQGMPGTPTNMLYSAPMLLIALLAGLKENSVVGVLNQLVKLGAKKGRPSDTPQA